MTTARRALVVEDEFLIAMLLDEFLSELGYSAVIASSAKMAKEIAAAEIATLDLAIVDLGLPDLPGHEVVDEIRRLRDDLPIIIASGRAEAEMLLQFAGLSRIETLRKPFTQERLAAAIASVVR